MNQEAWCSLALAILSPKLVLPEQAFDILAVRAVKRQAWDVIVPEILAARAEGISWREVAGMFGYSVNGAQAMVSHWKKRNRKAATQ
jgi:hypothetical protein